MKRPKRAPLLTLEVLARISHTERHFDGAGDDFDEIAGLHLDCEANPPVFLRRGAIDFIDGGAGAPSLGARDTQLV